MALEISQSTLDKTDKCPLNKRCLKEGEKPKCEVDRLLKGNGVFVSSNDEYLCPYKMSFGNAYVCNCPTRYEIFDKYDL